MKKLIAIAAISLGFGFAGLAFAGDTYVQGYLKKDGTYVQGHFRSNPNDGTSDNWSTKGNVNPYTGKKGDRKSSDYDFEYKPNKKSKDNYYR